MIFFFAVCVVIQFISALFIFLTYHGVRHKAKICKVRDGLSRFHKEDDLTPMEADGDVYQAAFVQAAEGRKRGY